MSDDSTSDTSSADALRDVMRAGPPGGAPIEALEERLFQDRMRVRMLRVPGQPVALGVRYTLRERLGGGGMGVVFRAFDSELEREVAIKMLHARNEPEALRSAMQHEARAMAKVMHPNVVQVFDCPPAGEDGLTFVVMALVDGTTLRGWLHEHRPSARAATRLFLAAADGLAAIHHEKLVHRDIKPDNILVSSKGNVLIGDFGLVLKLKGEVESGAEVDVVGVPPGPFTTRMSDAGALIGTLAYMAPEQLRGEGIDARGDQFSFFVSLFEAVCGVRPFQGDDRRALLAAIVTGTPARQAPWWLRGILRRGLNPDRDARFASMSDARRAMKQWLWWSREGLAIVGMIVVGLVAAAILWNRAPGPCDQLAVAMAETWSPVRQEAIGAAVRASDEPGALAAWGRFVPAADAYVSDWTQQKQTTCRALERLDGAGDPELWRTLAARDACLDESAALLRTLVERYRSRPGDVAGSDGTLRSLWQGLDRCRAENLPGLSEAGAGRDPGRQRQVTRIEATVAEATADELAGDYEAAVTRARAAATAAAGLDYGPLVAAASLRAGRSASLLRHPGEAAFWLTRAEEAATRWQEDGLLADARVELVKLTALDFEDMALAEERARLLDATLAQIPDDRARHADACEARAILAWQEDRIDDAIRGHREALDLRLAGGAPLAADVFRSRLNLAIVLSAPGATEIQQRQAAEQFKLALQESRELRGDAHPRTAEVRINYALFLAEIGDLVGAREQLRLALPPNTRVDPRSRLMIKGQMLAAELALLADDWQTAYALAGALLQALDVQTAGQQGTADQISTLQIQAQAELMAELPEAALRTYERLIALTRAEPSGRTTHGEVLGYSAEVLLTLGRPREALPRFEQARQMLRLGADSREDVHVLLLVGLAETYRALGDPPAARDAARQALAVFEALELGDTELRDRIDRILSPRD